MCSSVEGHRENPSIPVLQTSKNIRRMVKTSSTIRAPRDDATEFQTQIRPLSIRVLWRLQYLDLHRNTFFLPSVHVFLPFPIPSSTAFYMPSTNPQCTHLCNDWYNWNRVTERIRQAALEFSRNQASKSSGVQQGKNTQAVVSVALLKSTVHYKVIQSHRTEERNNAGHSKTFPAWRVHSTDKIFCLTY